jgi:hypothetical protein
MTGGEGESELDADERELAERLAAGRPVPAAEFRGALGRHLTARDPGYGPRPAGLRRMIALYLGAGGLLLVVGALQAGGVI